MPSSGIPTQKREKPRNKAFLLDNETLPSAREKSINPLFTRVFIYTNRVYNPP
jgi:hypothetical protein